MLLATDRIAQCNNNNNNRDVRGLLVPAPRNPYAFFIKSSHLRLYLDLFTTYNIHSSDCRYSSNTGYIACPEAPSSCPAPPEWFPDLKKPLGKPKGPRQLVGPYAWTREFEHASVRLDLFNRNASKVTYH